MCLYNRRPNFCGFIETTTANHPEKVSIHRWVFFNMNAKWNINQYFDIKRYKKAYLLTYYDLWLWFHIINTKRIWIPFNVLAWTENKLMIETSKRAQKIKTKKKTELIIEKENEMKIEWERKIRNES
jgi:hypothetical protein